MEPAVLPDLQEPGVPIPPPPPGGGGVRYNMSGTSARGRDLGYPNRFASVAVRESATTRTLSAFSPPPLLCMGPGERLQYAVTARSQGGA